MDTLINLLSKYSFGKNFKLVIRYLAVTLILFHLFVFISPFIGLLTDKQIENIQNINDPISNISLAVILMLLVVEGQGNFYTMVKKKREEDYNDIEKQITDWFEENETSIFNKKDINPGSKDEKDALRNFKVIGNYEELQKRILDQDIHSDIKEYCEQIHFEFTLYSTEILYGIHIELDNYDLSYRVYEKLNEVFAFEKQCVGFKIDNITPKIPSWVFLVKLVEFENDIESNFPQVLTNARHFVELVGHAYDIIYSEDMVKEFTKLKSSTLY